MGDENDEIYDEVVYIYATWWRLFFGTRLVAKFRRKSTNKYTAEIGTIQGYASDASVVMKDKEGYRVEFERKPWGYFIKTWGYQLQMIREKRS